MTIQNRWNIERNNEMSVEINIKLNTVNDVRKFVELTSKYPYKQELREDRFVVDARSILGILSLDLSRGVKYWCESYDVNLLDQLKSFVA